MIKFFYDSLETLQKVKFATRQDYISLGLWVIFAIIVCGAFFIGVDTILSGGYKAFYSIMKSQSMEDKIYDGSALSWDINTWDTNKLITTWADMTSGITVTSLPTSTGTTSTGL